MLQDNIMKFASSFFATFHLKVPVSFTAPVSSGWLLLKPEAASYSLPR